jgi:hypothetical protein
LDDQGGVRGARGLDLLPQLVVEIVGDLHDERVEARER